MNDTYCKFGVLPYEEESIHDSNASNGNRKVRHYKIEDESKKEFKQERCNPDNKKIQNSFNKAYKDAFKNDKDATIYDSLEKFKNAYKQLLNDVRQLNKEQNTNSSDKINNQMLFFVNFLMNRIAHNALEVVIGNVDKNIVISYDREDYDEKHPDVIYARLNGVETAIHSTKSFGNLLIIDTREKIYRPEFTILIRISPTIAEELEKRLDVIVDCLEKAKSVTLDGLLQEIENKIASNNLTKDNDIESIGKVGDVLNPNKRGILNQLKEEICEYWNKKEAECPLRQRILFDFTKDKYWYFDCPGYVTKADVHNFTEDGKHVIYNGDIVGKNNKNFDCDVYYARAVDLRDIKTIKDMLTNNLLNLQ